MGLGRGEQESTLRGSSMAISCSTVIIASLFVVALCPGATGSDERKRERTRGDDDPIIVPRSVVLPNVATVASYDPETTGSIDRRSAKVSSSCDRFRWYPERAPDAQFQESC